jgi:phosphopantothenoylcysteine decarboxylase/phosphopantothenate--cysteine ligase
MKFLENKKILIIITGGIAAYKTLDLIRKLSKLNCEIKTILTKSGKEFVTPLSITSLSKNKVYTDLFSVENESEIDHISLSRWSDLILVAPASSNFLTKISNGFSDDLASTVIKASDKKVFLCPAMNVRMWEHASNKQSISTLKSYGYRILGPEIGEMACGEFGEGKMLEVDEIINQLEIYFKQISKNKKLKAIVTAGPTQELIDPVRFITNRSSGKQGYEIANSLVENGFDTTLISGPTNLKPNDNLKLIKVKTGEEMYEKTMELLPCDLAIFTAAVSDFKVKKFNKEKIKKNKDQSFDLDLNPDILELVSKSNKKPKIVVGFAAESENLFDNARSKLEKKGCDLIVANDVSNNEIGFESDFNEVHLFYKDKNIDDEKIPKNFKSVIADELIKKITNKFNFFND